MQSSSDERDTPEGGRCHQTVITHRSRVRNTSRPDRALAQVLVLPLMVAVASATSPTIDLSFEASDSGSCPVGWQCTGDAYVTESQTFHVGDDQTTGSGTSLPFELPVNAWAVQFERAQGADEGSGFYVKRASDNTTVCACETGINSGVFWVDSCQVSAAAGMMVFLYLADNQASSWGKVLIDDITIIDAQGDTLVATTLAVTPSPTVSPTTSSPPSISPPPSAVPSITPRPTPAPTPQPTGKIDLDLSFEASEVGECPLGWQCTGDARVESSSNGQYFYLGEDYSTGTGTSFSFYLPANAWAVQFERGQGADEGSGFYVKRANDNTTVCAREKSFNSATFWTDRCNVTEAAGERVYIFVADLQQSSWGKVFIDSIAILDVRGETLVDTSLLITMPPTLTPTVSSVPTLLSPFPTPAPSPAPSPSPTPAPAPQPTRKIDLDLSFEASEVGECPLGWQCTGDARVESSSNGQYFYLGEDYSTGTGTSFSFYLPANAWAVQFERGQGADEGSGFYVKRANDNTTVCAREKSFNSATFWTDRCNVTEAAGERVYIFVADLQQSSWGKVLIDSIAILDVRGETLVDTSLLITMAPTPTPTLTSSPTTYTPFPTPMPSPAPSPVPTRLNERVIEADIMPYYPHRQVRSTKFYEPITLDWPRASAGECAVSLYREPYCRGTPVTLGKGRSTLRYDENVNDTVATAWSAEMVESATVANDSTRCYFAIFLAERCTSAGAVYLLDNDFYSAHEGGSFATLNPACGSVYENFFSGSDGTWDHWLYGTHEFGTPHKDIAGPGGSTAAYWIASFDCGVRERIAGSMLVAGANCMADVYNGPNISGAPLTFAAGGVRETNNNGEPCVEFPFNSSAVSIGVWSGNYYRETTTTRTYGGTCTCGDGSTYEVQTASSSNNCNQGGNANLLRCTNGVAGTCEYKGSAWAGANMKVTCARRERNESEFDHACGLGDVRLDRNGMDAFVYARGVWTGLCDHYFEDSPFGATQLCHQLGYDGGFGMLYKLGKSDDRLEFEKERIDMWRVGRCDEEDGFPFSCHGAGNHAFNTKNLHDCYTSLGILCDGSLSQEAQRLNRTVSCNTSKPIPRLDGVPSTSNQTNCADGDVMLVADGSLHNRTIVNHYGYGGETASGTTDLLTRGAGSPFVLFNGTWAPICYENAAPFSGGLENHAATTFCRKLGFSTGAAGLYPYSIDWLLPSVDLGMCLEGEELLECAGGDSVRRFTENCGGVERPHLVITCDDTFTGVAASCKNWDALPTVKYAEPEKSLSELMDEAQCLPNMQDHTERFPSELLTCPRAGVASVEQTTCDSLRGRDVYDRIVAGIVELYDSLSSDCDTVCCPQGDLAGCILRLAGHDMMDFEPSTGTGGSGARTRRCACFLSHDE